MGNCQTVFQSSRTILHSHQPYTSVPDAPHIHQHFVLSLEFCQILYCIDWYDYVVFPFETTNLVGYFDFEY